MNRACATLQANVMSRITLDSLELLKKDLISKKQKADVLDLDPDRNLNLIDLAIESRFQVTNLFNKCQRTVTKIVAERYAGSQHNLLKRSTKFGENIITHEDLSPCISTPEISDMYKQLLGKDPTNVPIDIPTNVPISTQNNVPINVPTDVPTNEPTNEPSNIPTSIPTTTQADEDPNCIKMYLKAYVELSLPPIAVDNQYNSPYEIASFLAGVQDGIKYGSKTISLFTVIQFLITENLIPIKKSSIYQLIDLYLCKCLDMDLRWSTKTTPGKKSMLSSQGFNYLVNYVQEKTLGGKNITLQKIKNLVAE